MNEDLISKFQQLKQKHSSLIAEKLKYEAKCDQLSTEIKAIQDKYTEYDLSTIESVESIIEDLTDKLNSELTKISEQYEKIKAI